MLEFRAILGMYICAMPVLWRDGTYHDLMADEVVVIERWLDPAGVGLGVTMLRLLLEKTCREFAELTR
jgi:hypothetical protein